MICPRCRQSPLYNYDHTVDVLACPVCGYREYPGFPARNGDQHEAMVRTDLEDLHRQMKELGLVGTQPLTKPCAICGSSIKQGSTYCKKCRSEVDRIRSDTWRKNNPEKYKEILRRHNQKRSREQLEVGAIA